MLVFREGEWLLGRLLLPVILGQPAAHYELTEPDVV